MARTAQISKEKWQSIITLRHEGQSIWNISRTLNISSNAVAKTIIWWNCLSWGPPQERKTQSYLCYDETGSHEDRHRKGRLRVTSAMMKLALMRTATGKEDSELPLLQRIISLELPASEIAAQINASRSSSNRHISTSTVQRRLFESGLHGRMAAKKLQLKDTNDKKRLAWAKKQEQWTLDQWKYVLWSDESKFEIFGSNLCVFVGRRVGELNGWSPHVWFPRSMEEEVWW